MEEDLVTPSQEHEISGVGVVMQSNVIQSSGRGTRRHCCVELTTLQNPKSTI